jgi:hypothetical protein
MLKRFMLRFRDMKTIGKLISGADEQANLSGEEKPGAELYVLSALCLEDGSAKRVLEKMGTDANKFRDAINQQYSDALSSIGISCEATETGPEPIESNKMFHNSQPSGQELMKSLYAMFPALDYRRPNITNNAPSLLVLHIVKGSGPITYTIMRTSL